MRRSFRDAIVGFSLLGGLIVFSGAILWLKGLRLESNSWKITASFKDASGLAEMSPVTYRGIIVGSVKKISVNPESVKTEIQINKYDLILPKPVLAKVVTSSVLGGDAQLALISLGNQYTKTTIFPKDKNCKKENILCDKDVIKGVKLTSISSLTEGLEQIIKEADNQKIVDGLATSIEQFDKTQSNLDDLILLSRSELERAKPIITELTEAAGHLNNILAAIDNPETLESIKETANSTSSITKKIDRLSSNMEGIIKDKELMKALRNITIGISKLFNELYP